MKNLFCEQLLKEPFIFLIVKKILPTIKGGKNFVQWTCSIDVKGSS